MVVAWAPVAWLLLAVVIVVCATRARRSRTAYRLGVLAVSALWVVAGAGVNAVALLQGSDYSGFADTAWSSFVQDTWESLVVPRPTVFIGMLIGFEAVVGALVLVPGRARQTALLLLCAFNVAVVSFGWWYLLWAVPMMAALLLLWRGGRSVA